MYLFSFYSKTYMENNNYKPLKTKKCYKILQDTSSILFAI